MASPAKQGPHQPQASNNTAPSAVPADEYVVRPSTPARPPSASARRSERRSGQRIEVLTLPGTRWDRLEIERQREQRGGREQHSDTTVTPSLNRLSVHKRRPQLSNHQEESSEAGRQSEPIHGTRPGQYPHKPSGHHTSGSRERITSQTLAVSSSPAERRRANRSLPSKQRRLSGQRGRSISLDQGPSAHFPPVSTAYMTREASRISRPIMARRPGRNQADHVAELKETINESLWKLSDIHEKLAPLGQQIVALEEELKAKESDGSVTLGDTRKLDDLYRAKVKLTEQETGILHNPPDDLINKMVILNTLIAREDTQAPGRGSAASKQRGSKRSVVDSDAAAVDSPGPSPNDVRSSDQLRRVKGQDQRSSSVASQTPRDGGSRLEDGPDGARGSVGERAKMLVLHAEVAYKQSKTTHDSDGERIHCTINGIRKDKGSGRTIYDIKDKDESENLLYTARAEGLLPIPSPGSQLPTFSPGKYVIALYPGTTTFYNAQVISLFAKRDVYSLKFEGEENEKEVKEVERRYVLDTKAR